MSKDIGFGAILMVFVAIIVTLALLPQIFNTQNLLTDKQTMTDEAVDISVARLVNGTINTTYEFTVTNYPSGWKTTECPLTSVVFGNSTDDYTVTTDYVINASDGTFTLKNTSNVFDGGNSTLIDYTYCDDGYNTDASARSIAALIGLFAVLALVVFVVYVGIRKIWDNY